MIASGVWAGTSIPNIVSDSWLGKPASAKVGTSGSAGARFGVVTASARSIPSLTCGTAGVSAVKAIKYAGKVRCRNPNSRIRDDKSAPVVTLRPELNSNLSSLGRILDGVFERVAEHLPEPEAVASDFNWLDIFHDQA